MSLGFRKSFKIGKNTRVNLSKTGKIGISTGTKGARASVNNKGLRTQVSKNGMYYREQKGFADKGKKSAHKNNNRQVIFLALATFSAFLAIVNPIMFILAIILLVLGFDFTKKGE